MAKSIFGGISPGYGFAHLLRGILIIGMVLSFLEGRMDHALILLMSVAASGIIYYITFHGIRGMGEWLDVLFALLIVFNNLLGVVWGFYQLVPGWDIATHYTTSVFLAVGAVLLLERAYPAVLFQAPKVLVGMAVLLFSLGLGALWELGEFGFDVLFQANTQNDLVNTMQDLFVDGIAGLIVGIAWIVKRRK